MDGKYDLVNQRVKVLRVVGGVFVDRDGDTVVCSARASLESRKQMAWDEFVGRVVLWIAGTNEHKMEFIDKLLDEGSAAVAVTGGEIVVAVLLGSEEEAS